MANTALEQIKKLDDQKNKLRDQAKLEGLARAHEAIEEVNALGFSYSISERPSSGRGRGGVRQKKDAPCPICKFKTNPPHDGRRHRSQGNKKTAFTNQELASLGYSKV
jgi:hypothetical protein